MIEASEATQEQLDAVLPERLIGTAYEDMAPGQKAMVQRRLDRLPPSDGAPT